MFDMEDSDGEIVSEDYDKIMAIKSETNRQEELKRLQLRIGEDGPPLNVVIIGTPGSGKSSFINTVITSITKQWRQYAITGHYDGSAVTKLQHLLCYEKEKYLKFAEDKTELLKYNFPTLVDLAGFTDADDYITKNLLELVFSGRIPTNAVLSDVEKNLQYNATNLDEIYPCGETNIKVDRVIFVASASNRSPPFNLMRNLYSCFTSGPRAVPVFGVITKIDQPFTGLEEEDYKAFVSEFKSGLGILDINILQCTNYCDANLKSIQEGLRDHLPHIDTPVLRFLIQVLDPAQRVVDNEEYRKKHDIVPEAPPVPVQSIADAKKHSKKNLPKIRFSLNNLGEYLMVAIFILLFAVFIILFRR